MFLHLNLLKEILKEKGKDEKLLFFCIEDLVTNGLTLSRFSECDSTPSRQDITQFISAWLKFTGIPTDECREWLLSYCIDVLFGISSSSKSQIRHSTRSNIKYIYGSDVSFDCRCEYNIFKAHCQKNCPVYLEMLDKYSKIKKTREEEEKRIENIHRVAMESAKNQPKRLPHRDRYKEQFENAIKISVELMKQGYMKREIAGQLNEKGFKTRTGMKWTAGNLSNELSPYNIKTSQEELDKAMEFALDLVKQGVSKREIANQLNNKGFKTQKGKEWQKDNLELQLKKYKAKSPL
jgi:hypothetical protein